MRTLFLLCALSVAAWGQQCKQSGIEPLPPGFRPVERVSVDPEPLSGDIIFLPSHTFQEPVRNEDEELGWRWWIFLVGGFCFVEVGGLFVWRVSHWIDDGFPVCIGFLLIGFGLVFVGLGAAMLRHAFMEANPSSRQIVTQKYLTARDYCNTGMNMANVLNADKQIAVIGALAEGSSIRELKPTGD